LNSQEAKSPATKSRVGRSAIGKSPVGKSRVGAPADAGDRFSSLWRQYGRGILGLLILVLVVHDIFGTHGFLAMRRTQAEISTVKANLVRLNAENDRLAEHVHDLKSDPHTIEKLAREGSLLAKPGEVIIKIPQAQWLDQDSPQKP
jgi:cell division protein FtsB